jgi:hypothetical protein
MLLEIPERTLIDYINEKEIKTLLVTSPNYEERSLALPAFILNSIKSKQINEQNFVFKFLTLQGSRYQAVGILDELKQFNIDKAKKDFANFNVQWKIIDYPDGYNQGTISDLLKEWAQQLNGVKANIIVDISGLPRSIIIDLSRAIDELPDIYKTKIQNIFVIYTSAKTYPQLRYPQDIGSIRAHFSKRPIQDMIHGRCSRVETTIFPGIQGFEAKLLIDELHNTEGSRHILVFASGRDFMTSMIIMRANQLALQQAKDIEYYFSIPDGVRKMEESISSQIQTVLQRVVPGTFFLIAPFGPKPFAWVSYSMSKKIKTLTSADAEIALLSGFQYTSVYSLGKGHMSIFQSL